MSAASPPPQGAPVSAAANGRRAPALRSGTRLRVRAGHPTAEELAAVVIALDAAARTPRWASARPAHAGPPAWQRAARLEGAGIGRPATPGDLERLRR